MVIFHSYVKLPEGNQNRLEIRPLHIPHLMTQQTSSSSSAAQAAHPLLAAQLVTSRFTSFAAPFATFASPSSTCCSTSALRCASRASWGQSERRKAIIKQTQASKRQRIHCGDQMEDEIWVCLKMLCTPLYPMVLLIIIPIKWLFHWEYTQHFQTNPYRAVAQVRKKWKLQKIFKGSFGELNGDRLDNDNL